MSVPNVLPDDFDCGAFLSDLHEAEALGHEAEFCDECKEQIVGQACSCFRYPFTERGQ